MRSDRRLGLLLGVIGAIVAFWVQVGAPIRRVPLYDGVVVTEPYRWLDPPPFNRGGALGVSETVTVTGARNPVVAVATDELPPQAQVLATPGALTLHAGVTSISVAIDPVPPPVPPPSGFIDGNVYEFRLVDDAGRALTAPAATEVTVVLRSADALREQATIIWFDGSAWVSLPTTESGPGEFFATVTAFGDFAVLAQGDNPYATLVASVAPSPTSEPAQVPSAEPVATEPVSSRPPSEVPASGDSVPLLPVIIGGILVVLGAGFGLLVWLQRREDRRRGF